MASTTPIDIYTTPAGPPPPGVVPNLKNSYTLHKISLTTMLLCLILTSIAVTLRTFTKVHLMRQVKVEDYALLVAQLGFVAWVALNIAAPGQGHHLWDVSIYDAMQTAKVGLSLNRIGYATKGESSNQYVNWIITLYGPLVFFAKVSVLMQLQHIFVTHNQGPVFYLIQALMWANFAFYVSYLFVDIFQCVPRDKIWDSAIPGKCISLNVLLIAPAGINILSDCLILVLPMIVVIRLKITLKNKLTIIAVFGSGLFAVISGVMRLVYSVRMTRTTDTLWGVYPIAMWTAAELATVILAATFPTMPRLWIYIQTGDRNAQRYNSGSASCLSRKPRQLGNTNNSATTDNNTSLKRGYLELHDGRKGCQRDNLEMNIIRTESYEVTTGTRGLPDNLP